MFRGRTPRTPVRSAVRPPTRAPLVRAVDHVEMLEGRRLLTTLVGGQTFHYYDADNHIVRIKLVGNITAEFTGARVSKTTNQVVIRDLIPANPPPLAQPTEGADLFNIYIAEADADAQIIITQVPRTNAPDRLATPYSGSPGIIRGLPNNPDDGTDPDPETGVNSTITLDSTGVIYIGARTNNLTSIDGALEADLPLTLNNTRRGLGVRPPQRRLYAGIQTAPGISMGKIFIGGTITGVVNIEGSVGTFYAGNIVTGDAGGLSTGLETSLPNNFTVAGDLQNLYVGGSVGTTSAGNYRTGTNVRVGGRLGNLRVGNAWSASLSDFATSSATTISTPSEEAEYIVQRGESAGSTFLGGLLSGTIVRNDADDAGQFASSFGDDQTMSWSGTLQGSPASGDAVDNYSLPLLAGQSASIRLDSDLGLAQVGVFDPLGRLVTTDIYGATEQNTSGGTGQQFQIIAKIPGVYRLAVALAGNNTFNTAGGPLLATETYTLVASGVGNVPVGGALVSGVTHFREPGNGVAIRNGDLGAWVGRGTVSGATLIGNGFSSPINISRGNIRAITGGSIGIETPIASTEYLRLVVPRGSVGYLHATAGTNGDIVINPDAIDVVGDPFSSESIGGDYQRVEAVGEVDSALVADGSIGSIIAGGINSNTRSDFTPIFSAGTNGGGGNIDMIYVSGDVGSPLLSGPGLYNGLSGNIKYFHVGGTTYRDFFFGGVVTTAQSYSAGRAVRLTDDSGAVALISPTSTITTATSAAGAIVGTRTTDAVTGVITVVNADGTTTTTAPGRLTLTAYPVRGTGGSVLVNATSTTSLTIGTRTGGGQFDVTDVVTNSDGSPVVVGTTNVIDPATGTVISTGNAAVGYNTTQTSTTTGTAVTTTVIGATPAIPNEITFAGSLPVNVMHVTGNNVTALYNYTSGEIGSANVTSLGTLIAQTAGKISGSMTDNNVVVPTNLIGAQAVFPFDGFSQAIQVTGSAVNILARAGIGNVRVGATLAALNPNIDQRNARNQFDGIDGNVQAGTFNVINIGEGIGFGGTGGTSLAGVFAVDSIVNLVGNDADIRGPVISTGSITTITLNNGSIVNTRVGVFTSLAQGAFTNSNFIIGGSTDTSFSLARLQINGDGGILGSDIEAGTIGIINVGGFGILASTIDMTATNRANGSITAAGFGIRLGSIDVGSSINEITASGNGKALKVSDYNDRVTQTGSGKRRRFDAYSGRLLTGYNDLNRLFGTSKTKPRINGITNSGVIQDMQITGAGDLGTLSAYAISSTDVATPFSSSAFPMRIVFANTIGEIDVASTISGLALRTGSLTDMSVGGYLERAQIAAAGEIGSINVGKTVRGSTSILAQGDNGQIGSITARNSLYGSIQADKGIDLIAAGTYAASTETSGSIGSVRVNDDVLADSLIRARRAIDLVVIDGDFQEDAVISAANVGRVRIGGANNGTINEGTT